MRISRGLVATVMIAAATGVSADEPPMAADLLKEYFKSVDKMTCVRFSVEESVLPGKGDRRLIDRTESRIMRDGRRWKLDVRENAPDATAKMVTQVWRQTLIERDVLQAETVNPDKGAGRPRMSAYRFDRPQQHWRFLGLSAIVFGHLPGDAGMPIWDIVRDASSREVLPQAVEIDGAETYVVKCRGRYGEHQLWLDPQRGGLPLRVEIQKRTGDLHDDEQLGSAATGQDISAASAVSIQIRNIRLSQREGVHYIVHFEYEFTATYPDETSLPALNRKQEYRNSLMDMFSKPMTDAIYRFDMQIPNGTRVDIFKNSSPGIRPVADGDFEVWTDGKLQRPARQ